jgi:hypothetical protein
VIEVEWQVVLNTHIEHEVEDTSKNGRISDNGAYEQYGPISMVMMASRPKVSF